MSENIADGTVETLSVEELQAKLNKAEAKIVDLKQSTSATTPETLEESNQVIDTSNLYTKEDKARDTFFDWNSNLVEYEKDLKQYVDKGNSWEDAKFLLERNDATFWNRAKTNSMNLTNWDSSSTKTSYTVSELETMTQSEYNSFKELQADGKVTISG